MRIWLMLAGLNGAFAVAAGAYGWHWLAADEGARQMFMLASTYQMVHAAALLGTALLAISKPACRAVKTAGASFVAGIVLFCGTLYHFGPTGDVLIPGAAPVGGGLLIVGWLALAWAGVRHRS